MDRGPTGRIQTTRYGVEQVRAFIPNALPPVPAIDLSGARQSFLEKATLACGRLDGVSALLPSPDLFLYAYVRREAVVSSQIEGTQSSLSDLLLFELDETPGVPFDDVVEASNYVSAIEAIPLLLLVNGCCAGMRVSDRASAQAGSESSNSR
jgi:hypothetical protein